MYGSMEESTPAAEAPALGPAELKAVRKLLSATSKATTGDDDRPAGLLHEPQELSTSTLTKLEIDATLKQYGRPYFHGTNAEAERILKCIKRFSADEWKGCTNDEKFDCGCTDDEGINYCCGSADQAEAIEIWSQCLAGA